MTWHWVVSLFPTTALSASGSEGLISARVLRHPYCLNCKSKYFSVSFGK